MNKINGDWSDVWSEYQRFFGHFALSEEKARAITTLIAESTNYGPDRVADALKEFAVRAQERGVPVSGLRIELSKIKGSLEISIGGFDMAARNFGTAAEDLGVAALRTLAELVVLSVRERH